MRRTGGALCAIVVGLALPGCRRPNTIAIATPPSTQPGIATTGPTATFSSGKLGIGIDYPKTWIVRPNADYELFIVPPAAPDGRSISLDVPDLPFHIPGMIPMGSVQSGYVDDVNKQFGAVKVEPLTPPTLPKCSARLVRCTAESNGHAITDIALLIVHSDRVYILRASTDAAGEPEVRAAFDGIVKSLRWAKP